MKKKQHKIGTTILLALAPACALGVTIGVLATSIKGSDQGGEISEETFLDKYEKIWNTKTKSTAQYTNQDITNGVVSGTVTRSGTSYKLVSLEYMTRTGYEGDCYGTFEDQNFGDLSLKRSATREALADGFAYYKSEGLTMIYEASSNWISYKAIKNDEVLFSNKYNNQGYILESVQSGGLLNETNFYQITYTQDPK